MYFTSSWFFTACSMTFMAEWLSSHSRKIMFSNSSAASPSPTGRSAPSLAHARVLRRTRVNNSTSNSPRGLVAARRTHSVTISTLLLVPISPGISLAPIRRSTSQGPRSPS